EAAADARAFAAALGGPGACPNPRRARVIWLSLAEGGEALESLARGLEAALRRRGFGAADKPFSAHLTIGRVRDPREDWSDRLAAAPAPDPAAARFTVDR